MRIISCKKCGTRVSTDSSILESLEEQVEDLHRKLKRSKSHDDKHSALAQIKQINKVANQIRHESTMADKSLTESICEAKAMRLYMLDNGLATQEQINGIREYARREAARSIKKREEHIQQLYRSVDNKHDNNTKRDQTFQSATRKG